MVLACADDGVYGVYGVYGGLLYMAGVVDEGVAYMVGEGLLYAVDG